MGAWGPGLYANDCAADLKSTIAALAKLPFDGERIAEILRQNSAVIADDDADEDYTTFWLVAADQFLKRGIRSETIRQTALTIIESGQDLTLMANLGLAPIDLKKRRKTLNELKTQLDQPIAADKPRKTLAKPQPLLLNVGDVYVYPVSQGLSLNPYFTHPRTDYSGFHQDGWGALCIVDSGRAFDFLAWYSLVAIDVLTERKLSPDEILADRNWILRGSGTVTASHRKKLELEQICSVAVDRQKVLQKFPAHQPGISEAVDDISISNVMRVGMNEADASHWFSKLEKVNDKFVRVPSPSIHNLNEILV